MKFDCGSERESSLVSVPWSLVPRGSENGQRTKDEGRRTSEGFTLLELMIVITLVLILAAMAMPTYHVAIVRARESVLREDLDRKSTRLNSSHFPYTTLFRSNRP